MQIEQTVDLPLLRRAMEVERWHTLPTMGRQTVGTHTAIMLLHLYCLVKDPRQELVFAVLAHDASEHKTGDIPSPEVRRMSAETVAELGARDLQVQIDMGFPASYSTLHPWEQWVVHYLDTIEAAEYSLDRIVEGNQFGKACLMNCVAYLKTMDESVMDVEMPSDVLTNIKLMTTKVFNVDAPSLFKVIA